MSLHELEQHVRQLSPVERRRFIQWVDESRDDLLSEEPDEVKEELRRRRKDYEQNPDQFETIDEAGFESMLREIEDAPQTRPPRSK